MKKPVVLRVGELRLVEGVVLITRPLQRLPKLLDALVLLL
jgi:hypothetical protein